MAGKLISFASAEVDTYFCDISVSSPAFSKNKLCITYVTLFIGMNLVVLQYLPQETANNETEPGS